MGGTDDVHVNVSRSAGFSSQTTSAPKKLKPLKTNNPSVRPWANSDTWRNTALNPERMETFYPPLPPLESHS